MRSLLSTMIAAALLTTGITAGTAATSAAPQHSDRNAAGNNSRAIVVRDSPGCVTKREYRRTHKRMRIRRIHRIYDTHGWRTHRNRRFTTRRYGFCKGARHAADAANAANAANFAIRYRKGNKRILVRNKYCGPSLKKRRRCF